jgi:hypothetical protein
MGRASSGSARPPTAGPGASASGNGKYDLTEGALFLVASRGRDIRVTQIDRDLSRLKPAQAGIEVLTRDAEVREFVAEAANRAPGR